MPKMEIQAELGRNWRICRAGEGAAGSALGVIVCMRGNLGGQLATRRVLVALCAGETGGEKQSSREFGAWSPLGPFRGEGPAQRG